MTIETWFTVTLIGLVAALLALLALLVIARNDLRIATRRIRWYQHQINKLSRMANHEKKSVPRYLK